MKKLTAALLVLCMALTLAACDLLPGKTETIYVNTRTVRNVYDQEIVTDYTYSQKGVMLTSTMYFNGNLYQKLSRRTSGGVAYITVEDGDGNSSVQTNTTTYDDNGNVTMVETGYNGNTVSSTTYTYDEAGLMLTATTVTSTTTTATVYTYDDRGNMASATVTVTGDTESYKQTTYAYDDRDYVTLEQIWDEEGVLQSYLEYTYTEDDSGRTVTHFNGDGTATGEVDVYTYDEHGNVLTQTTTLDGEVAQTITYTYEALAVPVEE